MNSKFLAREGDDLKNVLDHITQFIKDSNYKDIIVSTINNSYSGRFLQRGSHFLLLANETRSTNLGSGNKVFQIHYIAISSIIGITIDTDEDLNVPE